MMEFWTSLGALSQVAIYLAGLSVVGIVFGKLAEKTGVIGTIFKALKAVVDLLIGNLSHKK